jgi:hypothetical protein
MDGTQINEWVAAATNRTRLSAHEFGLLLPEERLKSTCEVLGVGRVGDDFCLGGQLCFKSGIKAFREETLCFAECMCRPRGELFSQFGEASIELVSGDDFCGKSQLSRSLRSNWFVEKSDLLRGTEADETWKEKRRAAVAGKPNTRVRVLKACLIAQKNEVGKEGQTEPRTSSDTINTGENGYLCLMELNNCFVKSPSKLPENRSIACVAIELTQIRTRSVEVSIMGENDTPHVWIIAQSHRDIDEFVCHLQ